jgi:Xaa-Pro aminopeptidase
MLDIREKIYSALQESDVNSFLVVGWDNFNYLTRTVLPFAQYYPDKWAASLLSGDEKEVIICPLDWSQAIYDQGWKGELLTYDENDGLPWNGLVIKLAQLFEENQLTDAAIGIDMNRAPRGFIEGIGEKLSGVKWKPIDSLIWELRKVKTPGEITLIETACHQADRGILHALNHLEGTLDVLGYTIAEFSERIRVHINEGGGSGVGLISTTLGPDAQLYYTQQKGLFRQGEIFRMDVTSHYMGYWTNLGRMGVTGEPTNEQETAYGENQRLKKSAEEMLKPGLACNEVFAHVSRIADKDRIAFWKDVGIGHGVGVNQIEPPYLNLSSSTQLQPGMVVALDIYTYGPRKELIHDKDIYAITEDGSKKLSWYKNWDRIYPVTGRRATH